MQNKTNIIFKMSKSILLPVMLLLFSCSNSEGGTKITNLAEAKKMAKVIAENSKDKSVVVSDIPVIVFAADWCPACRAAEADLKRRNIKYTRADIDNNPKAKEAYSQVSQRTGSTGIPQIIVGTNAYVGYSWAKIEKAIFIIKKEII